MRVVLDSSVLVAAFSTHGLCEGLFEVCLKNHEIVASERIVKEVEAALIRLAKVPGGVVREIVQVLRSRLTLVDPAGIDKEACRDPDDLHVLGAAIAAHAEALVSGDQDLLDLKKFRGIPVLTPREFWTLISTPQG